MTDPWKVLEQEKKLTPGIRKLLEERYGQRGVKALEIVDEGRVKKYEDFFVVVGSPTSTWSRTSSAPAVMPSSGGGSAPMSSQSVSRPSRGSTRCSPSGTRTAGSRRTARHEVFIGASRRSLRNRGFSCSRKSTCSITSGTCHRQYGQNPYHYSNCIISSSKQLRLCFLCYVFFIKCLIIAFFPVSINYFTFL